MSSDPRKQLKELAGRIEEAKKQTAGSQYDLSKLTVPELREYRALLLKAKGGSKLASADRDWSLLADSELIRVESLHAKMGLKTEPAEPQSITGLELCGKEFERVQAEQLATVPPDQRAAYLAGQQRQVAEFDRGMEAIEIATLKTEEDEIDRRLRNAGDTQ